MAEEANADKLTNSAYAYGIKGAYGQGVKN